MDILSDDSSFCLCFDSIDGLEGPDEQLAQITVTSKTDGNFSVLFDYCTLSEKLDQASFDFPFPIENPTIKKGTAHRQQPDIYGNMENPTLELTFQILDSYSLYGNMEKIVLTDSNNQVTGYQGKISFEVKTNFIPLK